MPYNWQWMNGPGAAAAGLIAGSAPAALAAYTLSGDASGFGTANAKVPWDTKVLSGPFGEANLTVSGGTITIPVATVAEYSYFRVSGYLETDTNTSLTYAQAILKIIWDSTVTVPAKRLTTHQSSGKPWGATFDSGWLPLGQADTPTIFLNVAASDTSFSVKAASIITCEFI